MRKIKVLVDAHVFDGTYQGTTTYLKGLYNALVSDESFEITLAAHDISKLKIHFVDSRFNFIALPSGSKFKRLLIDLPKIIKKHKFDYAHFQYITPLTKECKYINTIHDLLFLEFPKFFPFSYRFTKKYTFKYSARKSDLICTVSNYSKNALIKYFGIDKDEIIITPNAIKQDKGDLINIKSKYNLDKYILFVSRFEPRKNHLLLLRAFVDLELYKRYKLVLIGKRNDVKTLAFNEYTNTVSEEINKSILYLEDVPINELNCFYKEADLFIYPSIAEGFGIPPLEAAVLGCKVLCSNETAMADFDFFGKYLFDPGDYEEFKNKIIRILADNDYPFGVISEAVKTAYNWKIAAKNLAKKIKHLD